MDTLSTRTAFKLAVGLVVILLSFGSTPIFAQYVGPFDNELSLSPAEQRRQNNISYGAQLGLIATHNASIPIGFVPVPQVSIPAELVGISADNSLKFTKPYLVAPPGFSVYPNIAESGGSDLCSYEIFLPRTKAKFENFMGFWPKLGDDRLFLPNDEPVTFGDLGTPELVHVHTDVVLSLDGPTAGIFAANGAVAQKLGQFDDFEPIPQTIFVPAGSHDLQWEATTVWYPLWDLGVPLALVPLMAATEAKFAKYIDKLRVRNIVADGSVELVTLKKDPKYLAKLFNKLNDKFFLFEKLGKLGIGGLKTTGEFTGTQLVERIFKGQRLVSRARKQNVTVYDLYPPTISTDEPVITFEATDIGGTRLSRYFQEFNASVTASDRCGRPVTLKNDAPEVLPLGDTIVTWTVRDAGAALPGIDHDDDGIVDNLDYFSRTLMQTLTVEDTQEPILVPPPGLVIESDTTINLDDYPLGQPLVVDLADLHPEVTKSTNSIDGNVPPDTRTVITWSAADDALPTPNVAMAEQLVTVKTPGSNTPPAAQVKSADTLTSKPVDIELTGTDPDLLPYSHDVSGPTVPDPLLFRIEEPPQNGEFVAPLLPFFIDDYRTDKSGGLIDYINSQPDAETLMADYIQAVVTNNVANFLNAEFCSAGVDAPVNFIYDPLYVLVRENGEQYFFDKYLECDPNGTGDPPWDVNFRISRWDANNVLLGHVRINDNGGGGIKGEDAAFYIDAENFAYFVQPGTGGEPVVSIQRCAANFTNTSKNPPYCQGQGFGPVDSNDVSGTGWDPESAFVDIERELVYVTAGPVIAVFDYRLENPSDPNSQRFRSKRIDLLIDDAGNSEILCAQAASKRFKNAVEVDTDGNLYVADTECHRVHKFSPSFFDEEGTFVMGQYIGWLGKCTTSDTLACDDANQRSKGFSCTAAANCSVAGNEYGALIGQFNTPAFLAINPSDILYVADYDNERVQRFGADGTFAGQAASTGNGINADIDGGFVLGNMGPPKHVSVNSEKFYVVDQSEHFVHIFDASPFKDVKDSSATVTYVSEFAFHSATDSFSYSVNDGLVDSNIAQVTIDVSRNYRQPVPEPQSVTVQEDGSIVIVITGTDPDGVLNRDFNGLDLLTVEVISQPEHGRLTAGGDTGDLAIDASMQVWTYTPGADFFGQDAFEFTVRDEFTDAGFDGQTVIPEPYGMADPGTITIDVISVNDIPIVHASPPEVVAAGFPMLLQGMFYDDFGTEYDAAIGWGDGQFDQDGEIDIDDNGTPNDYSDDTAMMTGVIYSTEGLNNIGMTPFNAMHVYATTGPKTIRTCFRDFEWLETCENTDIIVENRVAMGIELRLETNEVVDGILIDGEIEVHNGAPMAGVTGLVANNVVMRLEIPTDVAIGSVTTDVGVCNVAQDVLECNLGTMANGAVGNIGLTLRGSGVLVHDEDITLEAELRTDTPALADAVASSAGVKIIAVDLDRDADGLTNIFEASNGVSDPDADDDGDGLTNQEEFDAGTRADNQDSDGDGISDGDELSLYDSDPLDTDSDGDGLTDGDEVAIHGTDPSTRDTDDDGLPDDWELDNGYDPVVDDSGGDADGDGLSDRDEFANGSDHLVADTDGDTLLDGPEVNLYGSDPTKVDTDDDGLNDDAEIAAGTQVNKPDTDDDSLADGTEVFATLTQPLLADTDRDGLPDGFEDYFNRNPLLPDYRLGAGGFSTCALTDPGVACWGRNDYGQAPALVAGLNNPVDVTIGFQHACALDIEADASPSVKCWGRNNFGQRAVPPLVEPLQVAAGASHTCALDRIAPGDVEVNCWGRDHNAQVSTAPTALEQPVRLVAGVSGNSSCVLDNKATGPELICWGEYNNANTALPTGLDTNVSALALGSEHGCVVAGGERLCWGLNDDMQAPPGPAESFAVELSLGGFHSCALGSTEPDLYDVNCWGRNFDGQTVVPATLVNPLRLASGSLHSCAFDDGSAKCWGRDDDGQAPSMMALDIDPDGDGINTATEIGNGTDPLDPDTDRDLLDDALEAILGTDPTNSDTDGDGVDDGDEINVHGTDPLLADTDSDNMSDDWEIENGLQPTVADGDADADGDGLRNEVEFANGTNPQRADTDDDGISDLAELEVLSLDDSGQALGSLISEAVRLGDLDDDGDLDAVIANRAGGNIIWFNDGSGLFSPSPQGALNALEAVDVDLGDVDGDGDVDIAFAHPVFDDSNTLWLNGDADSLIGTFSDSGYDFGTGTSDAVRFTYMGPSPQRIGIFAANWGQSTHFSFVGGALEASQVSEFSNGNSEDVAIGDLDADGLDDAFIVNRDQPNDVLTARALNPTQFFSTEQQLGNSTSIAVALGDIDGDGDLDAYEVIAGAGDRVWLNDGSANFADSGQVLGTDSGNDVEFVDIDSDGDLDALVANSVTNRLWLNAGDGTFTDSGHTFGSGLSFGLSIGDLNGDGLPDIFVADDGANSVWFLQRLDPSQPDTDGDGAYDGWELDNGLDPLDDGDGSLDADGDGLSNSGEFDAGTDPALPDSDGDGMPDGWEVDNGLDPTVDDGAGDLDRDGLTNLDEFQQGMAAYGDDVPPLLSVPSDTGADSIGPFTNVPLGTASAVDARDGMIVPIASDTGPYVPGSHVITWSADDLSGNRALDSQIVDVVPHVSFAVDQTADEGSSIVVTLTLNGSPIIYPVQVDYSVSGTATNPADHDAGSGSVTIASGSVTTIPVNIVLDGVAEDPESFTFSITNVSNAIAGPQVSHTVTIAESNARPTATIDAVQDTMPITTAAADGGPITVSARVFDPNPADIHSYDWTSSDSGAFDPADAADESFTIDPSSLNPGFYRIAVGVSDNGSPIAMNEADMLLKIIATTPQLDPSIDSDNDGVDDATEGFGDIDNDRVPDYVDVYVEGSIIPLSGFNYVLETQKGLRMRLGEFAFRAGTVAGIAEADVEDDVEHVYLQGIADFEILGLEPGVSVMTVIPVQRALSGVGSYRGYVQGSWQDFVSDGNNAIATAPGSNGACASPGNAAYQSGLNPGDGCVQLLIEDGGPNDNDGLADGTIRFAGGVANDDDSDDDNDGMPDAWENANGLNSLDGDDAIEDPDMDSLSNLDEYRAGSDPHNPDTDADAVVDGTDNCPINANAGQFDYDSDNTGDTCDASQYSDVTAFTDVTGDSLPDLAGFVGENNGRPQIVVYSGANGAVHTSIDFINDKWSGFGIATAQDGNQDGTATDPAVSMLVVNKTTLKIRTEIRRLSDGAFLGSIQFFNANWRAIDVVVVDDLNGDGNSDDSAVAVLAERISDGRIQLQLRDLDTGNLVSNTVYLNARWRAIAAAVANRTGLPPVIGVIAHHTGNNKRTLQSRVAGTGAFDRNVKLLGAAWDYLDVSVNHDANGDGTADDPVWLVLAVRPTDNVIRVQSKFVANGAFDDNIVILNGNWEGFRLDAANDISGNNSGEMAISAIKRAAGIRRIHVKDYGTGATTINIAP